jgi:glyoxylase-like metal-dependent hydrolase (beta-lactamase superfamily II)/8-oxo-dGTP pyrophosphatase MutT (NUDIX family)
VIKPSAAVVPRLPDGRVLVGTRTLAARSFAGFLAFPGGATDPDDDEIPLLTGIETEHLERAGALRELGEETGRWMVALPDGGAADEPTAERFVTGMDRGDTLREVLKATGLVLDDRRLVPLGQWVTPAFMPRRFSVRQFLLPLDEDPPVRARPQDELFDIGWVDVPALWQRWRDGDALLLPPIRFVVDCLWHIEERGGDESHLVERLKQVPETSSMKLRDLVEGVAVQPLRSATLPPATHTNAVLLGSEDVLIVDPATPYDDEQERFDALLATLADEGRRVRAVVLTHHHSDHVADVARLSDEHGVEVWAHEETASRVDFPVHKLIAHNEELVCPGPVERRFRAIHTPGHARGHLCFLEQNTGVLVAGDMVAAVGSILIDPPEGHMGTYLESLERLLDEDVRRLIPAHGPMQADGKRRLTEQIEHREARHAQVLDALPTTELGATPEEMVPGIYGEDTPTAMYPLAARSVLAALELLVERGDAQHDDGRYRRAD